MSEVAVAVLGCAGRMGRALLRELMQPADSVRPGPLRLVGGLVQAGDPALGQDLGRLAGLPPMGLAASADAPAVIAAARVVIDFTAPAAALAHARLAAAQGRAAVIGTTGLDAGALAELRGLAGRTAILVAANTSLGVTLLAGLVRQAAAALGPDFDIEILEMHHRAKLDAPSGTALALGRAAAAGRGIDHDDRALGVEGARTGRRADSGIGYAVLRGGDIAGEHQVIFAGQGERVTLSHLATDRAIFARGALRAAAWLHGRPPGLYGMADVLGLPG